MMSDNTDKFLRDTQYNILGMNLAEVGTDTISRKAAIEVIDEIESEIAEGFGFEYEKWRKYFCELPPAQPKRIKGRWIEAESQCGIKCSNCGYPVDDFCHSIDYIDLDYAPNFCPNCGADMREVTT